MMRAVCAAAFAVATLAPVAANGQEPLTLEGAVRATLAQNSSLRAARAAAAEAGYRADQARSGVFPRVSFSESWQWGNQPVFAFGSLLSSRRFGAADFALGALNHPASTGFFHTTIGIEQTLIDGGRQRSAFAAAALHGDITAMATEEVAANLALAATETFGRVVASQADGRAVEGALTAAREDLMHAGRRRDAGMATDADVLGLAVHVANLKQRVIQAAGDAAVARAELNRLMGVPIDRAPVVVEPADPSITPDALDVTALQAEAASARPELRRASAAQQLADAGRRQAYASMMPNVVARAIVESAGVTLGDRTSAWTVGGELRWTFSTGGAELAQRKAAQESVARARAEADVLRSAVQVDVIGAVRRLETARARQSAGRAAVEQARESERIIRDRFEAGFASVNDVLRASTAVLDAEADRISALVDALVSSAMLNRALGRAP